MTGTIKKVLVVEDEDDIREVLCSALELVCKFTVEHVRPVIRRSQRQRHSIPISYSWM